MTASFLWPLSCNHSPNHRNRAVAGWGLGEPLAAGSTQPAVQIKTSSFLFIIFFLTQLPMKHFNNTVEKVREKEFHSL